MMELLVTILHLLMEMIPRLETINLGLKIKQDLMIQISRTTIKITTKIHQISQTGQ